MKTQKTSSLLEELERRRVRADKRMARRVERHRRAFVIDDHTDDQEVRARVNTMFGKPSSSTRKDFVPGFHSGLGRPRERTLCCKGCKRPWGLGVRRYKTGGQRRGVCRKCFRKQARSCTQKYRARAWKVWTRADRGEQGLSNVRKAARRAIRAQWGITE